jgi:hypothetical protein
MADVVREMMVCESKESKKFLVLKTVRKEGRRTNSSCTYEYFHESCSVRGVRRVRDVYILHTSRY